MASVNDTSQQTRLSVLKQHGIADALTRFGFKHAAEELRLKLPTRTFHGLEAAHKNVAARASKQATHPPDAGTADALATLLTQNNTDTSSGHQLATRDPLERATAWGAPSNHAGGDTASRLSDMGQQTNFGGV